MELVHSIGYRLIDWLIERESLDRLIGLTSWIDWSIHLIDWLIDCIEIPKFSVFSPLFRHVPHWKLWSLYNLCQRISTGNWQRFWGKNVISTFLCLAVNQKLAIEKKTETIDLHFLCLGETWGFELSDPEKSLHNAQIMRQKKTLEKSNFLCTESEETEKSLSRWDFFWFFWNFFDFENDQDFWESFLLLWLPYA